MGQGEIAMQPRGAAAEPGTVGDGDSAGRRIRPVPLDDPLEKLPHGAQSLPVRLRRDRRAARPGLGSKPHLVVLDVIAAHPRRCCPARRG